MKNLIYILVIALGIGLITSCEGSLSLSPLEDFDGNPGYPDFNFSFRAMNLKPNKDTSYVVIPSDTVSKSNIIYLELYLKQLTFNKKLNYRITYQINEGTDASLFYTSKEIRANDWLNLSTSSFIDDKLYIRFIPITEGVTTLIITCTDDSKKTKTFKKNFVIVK